MSGVLEKNESVSAVACVTTRVDRYPGTSRARTLLNKPIFGGFQYRCSAEYVAQVYFPKCGYGILLCMLCEELQAIKISAYRVCHIFVFQNLDIVS